MVSVIVPVYKVERYLKRCIDSLLNQTFADYEIILVDDGSPDMCPQICDQYADEYNNVHVIHKKNGGLSEARNVGAENAAGEYILFVDSDDYVSCDHISSLWETMARFDADIACSPPIVLNEISDRYQMQFAENDSRPRFDDYVVDTQAAQAIILRGNPVGTSAWSKIYKKEYCIKHPFPIGKIMEELATTYYILGEANRIALCGIPTYYYVQRVGSILHKTFTLNQVKEHIPVAERYYIDAPTDEIRCAAAVKIIQLAQRLKNSAAKEEKDEIYTYLCRICRLYLRACLKDKKTSLIEKAKAVFMSISPVTIELLRAYDKRNGR